MRFVPVLAVTLLAAPALAQPVSISMAAPPDGLVVAPVWTGGRVVETHADGLTDYAYQWPGVYFRTAFHGDEVYFRIGAGDVILHIGVDGEDAASLVKPAPGLYRIDGLGAGDHTVRIEVASENQAAPGHFGGFFLTESEMPLGLATPTREMEFIGDSYTVGYGNTSPDRDCTLDRIWATTDDTQAIGPITARHYRAAYRVNAISGRGVVRNYDGSAAAPLPEAYPDMLFDKSVADTDTGWQPQVVAIGLGANDFATALHPGEPWQTRDALHADYEAAYAAFVAALRARYPQAYFVLWATDGDDGETAAEARKVVERLRAGGEARVTFVEVSGLAMGGCDEHPTTADDETISAALIRAIDAVPGIWAGR